MACKLLWILLKLNCLQIFLKRKECTTWKRLFVMPSERNHEAYSVLLMLNCWLIIFFNLSSILYFKDNLNILLNYSCKSLREIVHLYPTSIEKMFTFNSPLCEYWNLTPQMKAVYLLMIKQRFLSGFRITVSGIVEKI